MKPTFLLFIAFFLSISTFSQTRYVKYALVKFRLETSKDTVTVDHLKNLDLKIYISDLNMRRYDRSIPIVKYDASNKEFTFYVTYYSENEPSLYISSKKDTVKISLPLIYDLVRSKPKSISIKPLINLQSVFYDFSQNRRIKAFFYEDNPSCQYTKDGYSTFYFGLPEKKPLKIDKELHNFTEIKIETDPFSIQYLF